MTIDFLKNNDLIIFECIIGSKAYGLDVPDSDTDIKGVFLLPENLLFSLDYTPQVSNETNDIVYYELKRFVELCFKNNPSVLEMLNIPTDKILIKDPIFEWLTPELFLSKRCKDSFAGYAISQIKKAYGLNKKILNPIPKEKKSILEFCYIPGGQGSVKLKQWLGEMKALQEHIGLVNIPNAKGLYGLFLDRSGQLGFKGVMKNPAADDVSLSSIPKGMTPEGYLFFNRDGYSKYCKDYRDYWLWVDNRNENRYESTIEHGKNYDAKNMMHTFRLLHMAREILETGEIIVKRPDRKALLEIRSGKFSYNELLDRAQKEIDRIEKIALATHLPDLPEKEKINQILIRIRKTWLENRRKSS